MIELERQLPVDARNAMGAVVRSRPEGFRLQGELGAATCRFRRPARSFAGPQDLAVQVLPDGAGCRLVLVATSSPVAESLLATFAADVAARLTVGMPASSR